MKAGLWRTDSSSAVNTRSRKRTKRRRHCSSWREVKLLQSSLLHIEPFLSFQLSQFLCCHRPVSSHTSVSRDHSNQPSSRLLFHHSHTSRQQTLSNHSIVALRVSKCTRNLSLALNYNYTSIYNYSNSKLLSKRNSSGSGSVRAVS